MIEVEERSHDIFETSQAKNEPEVWVHTMNFAPWTSVVGNSTLRNWVEQSGADKMEWIAAGKGPFGPTHEVLTKPVSALQKIFGERLGGGHVIFNPYASMWNIAARRPDPLRPGESMAIYNLFLAKQNVSEKALSKLNEVNNGKFPVVLYPNFRGEVIFGSYENTRYQTHPAVFNDESGAGEIVNSVKSGRYSEVCVDLYHFQEATSDGNRPFGKTEDELKRTLEIFRKEGVLGEIHVQPGRLLHANENISSEDDLASMFYGNYYSRMGQLIKFLIHDLEFMGPYTLEIDPRSMVEFYGKRVLFPPSLGGDMLEAQATAVDYIKRA
jgi:hypothetical protein